jgi:2-polyprenyl-3-methyl-5-hydroxy-6-metoxy-1,4-benzoquinol methylase
MGHEVVGVDLSREGIELARSANPTVRYEVASVYDDLSSIEPLGWNIVLASEVIEHLFDPPRFLNNVHGLLNPGGHLILTTPYHGFLKNLAVSVINGWDRHFTVARVGGHIKFFSARTLKEMLQAAGFIRPVFKNAGRLPFLWKSMVCRVERV